LESFPLIGNYKLDKPDLKVMFIGSGPLPITAWLLVEAISAK
jgi:hypothetical protein